MGFWEEAINEFINNGSNSFYFNDKHFRQYTQKILEDKMNKKPTIEEADFFFKECTELQKRSLLTHLFEFSYHEIFKEKMVAYSRVIDSSFAREFFKKKVEELNSDINHHANKSLSSSLTNLSKLNLDSTNETLLQLENKITPIELFENYSVNISLQAHNVALYYFVHPSTQKSFLIVGNQGSGAEEKADECDTGFYIYSLTLDMPDALNKLKDILQASIDCYQLKAPVKQFYANLKQIIENQVTSSDFVQLAPQLAGACDWNSIEMVTQAHLAAINFVQQDNINWQQAFKNSNSTYVEFINFFKLKFLKDYLGLCCVHKVARPELLDENLIRCLKLQIEFNPDYQWVKYDEKVMLQLNKLVDTPLSSYTSLNSLVEQQELDSVTTKDKLVTQKNINAQRVETRNPETKQQQVTYQHKMTNYNQEARKWKNSIYVAGAVSSLLGGAIATGISKLTNSRPEVGFASGGAFLFGYMAMRHANRRYKQLETPKKPTIRSTLPV